MTLPKIRTFPPPYRQRGDPPYAISLCEQRWWFCSAAGKTEQPAKATLLIGLESIAHYGENPICFLCGNGHRVAMINPLQTAAMQKFAIRKTKADKVDAFVIAKALMTESDARVLLRFFETFWGKYRLYYCKG